jgi:dolichol kinase
LCDVTYTINRLAEPVGVRWGRHKYTVNAWFSKQKYTRSIEGSLCVFISGIISLYLQRDQFTPYQYILAMLIFPISTTLAEAFAPHTMDTPLIFLVGGAVACIIGQLPI